MDIYNILKKNYGYSGFRPNQEAIIKDIINGKDCFVLMPTGGGKSLCYQIPALAMDGTAIVISPLISLMHDQVETLKANGIAAEALHSGNSTNEDLLIRRKCISGELKLIYISPEKFLSEIPYFSNHVNISLFAIDEAHCISQWGHDFRPEYSKLSCIHTSFPNTPIVALTATADKITREDIIKQLGLCGKTYISSFDRPNLSLNVRFESTKTEKIKYISNYIKRHPDDTGIIYCLSRKNAESLAESLNKLGIKAEAYHAGMPTELRTAVQERFKNDKTQVVCATIAFGMGIDKSNVRWIFHYNMPKSIENFYQEIGRAGRDGAPADTVLFYSLADTIQLKRFAEESGQSKINLEKLQRMEEYALSNVCRRRILLNYFGEERHQDCNNCDVCDNPPHKFDGTIIVQKALSAIARTNESVRIGTLIEILRGMNTTAVMRNKYNELKTFGAGKDISVDNWRQYIIQMLQLGFIEIAYNNGDVFRILPPGNDILYGRKTAELAENTQKPLPGKAKEKTGRRRKTNTDNIFPEVHLSKIEDNALFDSLKKLRASLAAEQEIPAYMVFSDKVLHALATEKPLTTEDFGNISGIGEFKKTKYGKIFTQLIDKHIRSH